MPIFAISLSTLVAIVAVAIAIASDSKAVNNLQVTADSAAIAGATAFVMTENPKAATRLAHAKEQAISFAVANSEYYLVDLDIDAISEDSYSQTTRIEVEVEFQPANVMARVAGRSGNMAIRRRASAEAVWGFPLCTLALSPSGSGISTNGAAQYHAQNCIVWSNSESPASMDFSGGSAKAQSFCSAGNVSGAARAIPSPETSCKQIPDPLANWSPPPPGKCLEITDQEEIAETLDGNGKISILNVLSNTLEVLSKGEATSATVYAEIDTKEIKTALQQGDPLPVALVTQIADILTTANAAGDLISVGGGNDEIGPDGRYTGGAAKGMSPIETAVQIGIMEEDPSSYADDEYVDQPTLTLKPGTYCGLDIQKGHVEMTPGVYHILDAPLTVRRRATLTGEGVTIVMSGEDATFNIIDEARLTLSAPINGETAGFALVEDKSTTYERATPPRSRLAGDGIVDTIGTIYLPRHDFEISGNGSGKQASPLLQIVANTVQLSDNGQLNIDFDTSQTEIPVGIKPERTARLLN